MTPDSHDNGQARHHGKHLVNPETTPQPATPASTKPEKQEKSNPLSPKSLDTPTFHWNTNQKTELKTQLMGINPAAMLDLWYNVLATRPLPDSRPAGAQGD
ncbi:hypothetical protein [Mobiluncus mulieris]|uniref:Uncharacterized protein n=1 Tax=Mobiluncus mulieris TaxID=2052 RepID=A0A7Y0UVE4_9ACTO|nr:hypothetical protein [Mobiluncus mulieris]NMX04473.1 hypothetical protein [Mobiluncus mulieris]